MSENPEIKFLKEELDSLKSELLQMQQFFADILSAENFNSDIEKLSYDRIKKLLETENHYKILFEESLNIMLFVDPVKMVITDANQAACDFYGYTKKEFVGLNASQINNLPDEEIELLQKKILTVGKANFIFEHILADKSKKNVEVFLNVIYFSKSPVIAVTVYDITEKVKAEKELKNKAEQYEKLSKKYEEQNNELTFMLQKSIEQNDMLLKIKNEAEENRLRFKFLSDATFEAIFLSENGKFVDANRAATDIFGYTLEEAADKVATDIIDENYRELVMKNYMSDYSEPYEVVAVKKNGQKFYAEIRGKTFNYDGRRIRISSFRDISEKKLAIEELKRQNNEYIKLNAEYVRQNMMLYELQKIADENRKRFETLANSTIEAVILSTEGFISEANFSATEMFDYTEAELKKMLITDLFNEQSKEKIVNNFILNYKLPYEVKCLKKNKTEFFALVKEQIIEIDGKVTRISTIHDISLFKITQNELERQNKSFLLLNEEYAVKNAELEAALKKAEESELLKSAFLANMSHEIRTPMNGIIGFAEMLKDTDITDEKRKQYLEIISNSSKQLLAIVSDILDISKIETGQVKINYSKISVNALLKNIYNEYQVAEKKSGINFSLFISNPDDEIFVTTDEQKLIQILENLVNNAFKFTNYGSIELGCIVNSGNIEFFVKDTGIGIAPEIRSNIFKHFIQGDMSYTKSRGGTGLGLAIAKSYSELLGGNIKFESELDQGTTFIVTLPLTAEKSKQFSEIKSSKNTADWFGKTILIVEDNKINYYFLHEVLSPTGVNILYAETGIEALKIFAENKNIELVLVDIKLPDISGYDVTAEIRKSNKQIPIIAQTAFAMAGDKQTALKNGCSDYISKPIKRDELCLKLDKYLKK